MSENIKIEPIRSLTDYIKLLESFPASDYIFRGEHCYVDDNGKTRGYDNRKASAFVIPNGHGNYADFMESIKDFFSQVGHNISNLEKEEFLAFSQHHGLKTNLLDVTGNPLVALFFACYEEHCCRYKKINNKGNIYIFRKNALMDITEMIQTSPMDNAFQSFAFGDDKSYDKMLAISERYFSQFGNLLYLPRLSESDMNIYQICRRDEGQPCFISSGLNFVEEMLFNVFCYARNKYLVNNNNDRISRISLSELVSSCKNDVSVGEMKGSIVVGREYFEPLYLALNNVRPSTPATERSSAVYYVCFLRYCLNCDFQFSENLEVYRSILPVMVYKPKIIFERARLQKGYFIYQPYKSTGSIGKKSISPLPNAISEEALKINIENTDEILKSLDNIGINFGSLFGDYDSIAKFIRTKHSEEM